MTRGWESLSPPSEQYLLDVSVTDLKFGNVGLAQLKGQPGGCCLGGGRVRVGLAACRLVQSSKGGGLSSVAGECDVGFCGG